jgi:hypothetical protein
VGVGSPRPRRRTADHGLVSVDDRAGDDAAAVGEQEDDETASNRHLDRSKPARVEIGVNGSPRLPPGEENLSDSAVRMWITAMPGGLFLVEDCRNPGSGVGRRSR